jgi:hypothetical protein
LAADEPNEAGAENLDDASRDFLPVEREWNFSTVMRIWLMLTSSRRMPSIEWAVSTTISR